MEEGRTGLGRPKRAVVDDDRAAPLGNGGGAVGVRAEDERIARPRHWTSKRIGEQKVGEAAP